MDRLVKKLFRLQQELARPYVGAELGSRPSEGDFLLAAALLLLAGEGRDQFRRARRLLEGRGPSSDKRVAVCRRNLELIEQRGRGDSVD